MDEQTGLPLAEMRTRRETVLPKMGVRYLHLLISVLLLWGAVLLALFGGEDRHERIRKHLLCQEIDVVPHDCVAVLTEATGRCQ